MATRRRPSIPERGPDMAPLYNQYLAAAAAKHADLSGDLPLIAYTSRNRHGIVTMLRRALVALTVLAALAGGVAGYSVLTAPPASADGCPTPNC